MHVEINNRSALHAVAFLSVARRDGGVVEQAKSHRARGLSMVARRPRRHECIRGLSGHHLVDRVDATPGGA